MKCKTNTAGHFYQMMQLMSMYDLMITVMTRYVRSRIKGVGSWIKSVESGITALGSGITAPGSGSAVFQGIRDHSPGIWDHKPWDWDQQCFKGSGITAPGSGITAPGSGISSHGIGISSFLSDQGSGCTILVGSGTKIGISDLNTYLGVIYHWKRCVECNSKLKLRHKSWLLRVLKENGFKH